MHMIVIKACSKKKHHASHSNGLSVDFAYAIYNQTNNEIKSKK